MTRRITLTMVAVVAGALLVASLVTVALSERADRRRTRNDTVRQAQRLAQSIDEIERPGVLRAVGEALRFQDQAIVTVAPTGPPIADLPAGVAAEDLDLARLRQGQTVSGSRDGLVFAAAPAGQFRTTPRLLVVVVTRRLGRGGGVGPILLLVGLTTLAVTAAIAVSLGRRLVRPLREAEEATCRIAAGDLAARVQVKSSDGEDLATLARSINSMAASLERSRGLERQFLLSVSHDLRTPLTSIRGYAEALADGKVPDPPQAATVILGESRRLERLVADLLELAKLGAGRYSLDLRTTDVGEVVGATVDGFLPAADEAGVAVVTDVPARGEAEAAVDPDRLAQVVANLVENALKFAASSIAVGAGRQDGAIRLWVDDDGPGIADDDLPHVFEPFYQSGRSPSRRVGTGLGLAIVHELVDAMGGTVQAEQGRGGGTRMVVSLRPPQ
ncbi:MAG: ATP-binding protein [Acidimicrobiales bacterium]